MNLDAITTPADLVRVNDEVKAYADELNFDDRIVSEVLDAGWEAGHKIVHRLLVAELDLHLSWIENIMESEGDCDKFQVACLSKDIFALKSALDQLDKVDLPDEESDD